LQLCQQYFSLFSFLFILRGEKFMPRTGKRLLHKAKRGTLT